MISMYEVECVFRVQAQDEDDAIRIAESTIRTVPYLDSYAFLDGCAVEVEE